MSKTHEMLCDAAKNALNDVFGDRSVGTDETYLSLSDLRDHICTLLDATEQSEAGDE